MLALRNVKSLSIDWHTKKNDRKMPLFEAVELNLYIYIIYLSHNRSGRVGLFSDDVSSDVAGDVAKLTWHRERGTMFNCILDVTRG